jgi:hypothetical protein
MRVEESLENLDALLNLPTPRTIKRFFDLCGNSARTFLRYCIEMREALLQPDANTYSAEDFGVSQSFFDAFKLRHLFQALIDNFRLEAAITLPIPNLQDLLIFGFIQNQTSFVRTNAGARQLNWLPKKRQNGTYHPNRRSHFLKKSLKPKQVKSLTTNALKKSLLTSGKPLQREILLSTTYLLTILMARCNSSTTAFA